MMFRVRGCAREDSLRIRLGFFLIEKRSFLLSVDNIRITKIIVKRNAFFHNSQNLICLCYK